jgi:hypothetical protein
MLECTKLFLHIPKFAVHGFSPNNELQQIFIENLILPQLSKIRAVSQNLTPPYTRYVTSFLRPQLESLIRKISDVNNANGRINGRKLLKII